MIIQHCYEPMELTLLQQLESRMSLSENDKKQIFSLQKGYQGERMFEKNWLEPLTGEYFIINDLLLEYNSTIFQIDSLLITQKTIHLFEVKNYEDDFYILDGKWISKNTDKEIRDPLLQLNRCESLLRRLLQELRVNLPVKANLIFINPHFTLYQAPLDVPIIFPGQIQRYMNKIESSPSKLSEIHTKLVDQLMARQADETKYVRLPSYEYDSLKKGIICITCSSFMRPAEARNKLTCPECGSTENIDEAVMRNIKQFQLLFPERKITTSGVYDWCGEKVSRKSIRRILSNHFKLINQSKHSYYIADTE